MVHTSIIPNREIIGILPSMSHLQIVVIDNQPHEPVKQRLRFRLREAVHPLHVMTNSKHRLPAGHGISAYHGMDGFELFAHVLGRAAGFAVDVEPVLGCCEVEFGLRLGGVKGLQESLVRLRNTAVEFVSGSPKSV